MGGVFSLTVAYHPAWPWSSLTRTHAQLSAHLAEGTRGGVGEGAISHMDLSGSRSISLASLPRPCCRAPRKWGHQLSACTLETGSPALSPSPTHPPSNHSEPSFLFLLLFLKPFLFCIGVYLFNNVIVSGAGQRESAIHTHVSILPQTEPAFFHCSAQAVCFLKLSP